MMWWWGNGAWGWGMMAVGFVFMIAFWAAIIALIVWAVRAVSGGAGPRERSALEIAKLRYARGEISREQYEQLRRDLA